MRVFWLSFGPPVSCHVSCLFLFSWQRKGREKSQMAGAADFFFSYLSLEFSNICLINEIATDLVRLCPIKMILQWPSFLQLGLMASVLFWGQDIFFFILDFLINFPSNYWVEYSLMIYTTAASSHVELRVKSNKRKMFRWMEFPAGELELSIKFALSKSKGKVTPLFPWLIVSTHQQRNLHFRQRRRETRWRRGAKTHPMAARAPPSQWDLRYHIWILSGTSGNKKQGSMPTYCSQCFQTTLKRRKSIELHFRS